MTTALIIAAILAAPVVPGVLVALGIIAWFVFVYQPETHER